jgi:hypothetical protein
MKENCERLEIRILMKLCGSGLCETKKSPVSLQEQRKKGMTLKLQIDGYKASKTDTILF